MQVEGKEVVDRESEDEEGEGKGGCWRKVQGSRQARVEVLDLENNTSPPKKEKKTKNDPDVKGKHKEMSSTFCHDIGKIDFYQGNKNGIGKRFEARKVRIG